MDNLSVEEGHEKESPRVTTRAQAEKDRLKTVRNILENVDTAKLFFAKQKSHEKELDVEDRRQEVENKTQLLETIRNYDESIKEKPSDRKSVV